jgi:hypothetical protein
LSLSLGLWLSSCIEETESPQIELTDHSKIATIKTWFEENESSLRVSKSGANYRTGDQELILPFFKKEPDWSMFTEYSFPDGRKVFEIHIKKLSGLVPKDFFEKYGSSTSDLTEESLLFVEHADSDVGFSVWVARYFSYGNKSKDMTYNRIPHNWSGRIDLFTFSEQHLRSFEVEDGRIIKTLEYMTGDENKRFSPAIMLMTCDVIWIDFPYYGIFGGVGSSQSVRIISCHNPIDRSGGAFNDFKDPDLLKPGGGNGNGVRLPEPVVCDDTNNFGSDCIPFPREMRQEGKIKLTYHSTLDARTRCVLDKLKTSSFVNNIADFMNTAQTSNTVIKTGITIIPTGSKDPANGQTKDLGNGTYEITISQQNLPDMRALEIARTTIHEIVHVEIFRALKSNGITPMDSNFPKNMDAFLNRYAGNTEDSHHQYMADRMIPKMAEALMEIHRTQFPNEYNAFWNLASFAYPNGADLNFYKNLFWGGMQGTKAYEKHKESPDFRYLKDLEQLRGYLKLACN